MKKIAIVTIGYPSPGTPTKFVFVKKIVESWASQGAHCVVIHPILLHLGRHREKYPAYEKMTCGNGGIVEVYRPTYFGFPIISWGRFLGALNPNWIKFWFFTNATWRLIKKIKFNPDVVYGHFLYFAGGSAIEIGRKFKIPSFIGIGEGEIWSVKPMGFKRAQRHLTKATGYIVNATHLMHKIVKELRLPAERMIVLPNGVDLQKFRPIDKKHARQAMGIPENMFVVGSVGNFLHKKGIARVAQAIEGIEDVVGVFAGSGPLPPTGKNVLWAKKMAHDQLPLLLSACDMFVLPTLIEGCCNAIIEAMACGLPIISSDGAFNDDLLDESMSIRIDPLDFNAIKNAIEKLRVNKELRDKMAAKALEKAKNFDSNNRAQKVLDFMFNSVACQTQF